MPTQRFGHTATLLRNGRVLVAGGACCGASPEPVTSAELYDATTGSWFATASMTQSHMYLPATLLPDGRVLVLGASNELYDAGTGSWTTTGTMITTGLGCSVTLLPDGKVLVAGGVDRHLNGGWGGLLGSAELYDPGTGLWTATASMVSPRCGTATLLRDGKVLVAGGAGQTAGVGDTSAELYDPGTGR
jgi:N-acetylneuraminic acid mutarotase